MPEVAGQVVVAASMEGRVIRCGCGDPLTIHGFDAIGSLLPCPTPLETNEVLTGITTVVGGKR